MARQPARSYADAVVHGDHGDHDTMTDMVAPRVDPPHGTAITRPDSLPVALVTTNSTAHNLDQPDNPFKSWDGERTTLAPFLTELEIALSAHDATLYAFAVDYYVILPNGKTVIAHSGQAAQLDGVLQRPEYSWNKPAPEDAASYAVDRTTIVAAVEKNVADQRLRNPSLPDTAPTIPRSAAYPVDTNMYMRSAPMLAQYDKRLRAYILETISNSAVKYDLARRFQGGRALLAHLRALSVNPLSSSEVRAILDDIDGLTDAGIAQDTEQAFLAFTSAYARLLMCIPDANAARDTPATSAMRFIKAVVKNRTDVGQAVMTHLRAAGVDQNNPDAVKNALTVYLADAAHMKRLIKPKPDATTLPAVTAADFLTALGVHPDPTKTSDSDKTSDRDKTSDEPTDDPTKEKLALVAASLAKLASRAESDALALCAVRDVVVNVPRSDRSA